MKWRACRVITALYVAACVVSLAFIPLSAAGIITRDPLAGIFAVILSKPWTNFIEPLFSSNNVVWNMVLTACGMVLNALILVGICRWLRGSKVSDSAN